MPPSKPSVPPVRRSLVVDTPFSKHFLGFLRLISRKDRRPRVEDFMVVNSYLSAWCPGCVGPPPIFIQQGIKLWNAFRKLSDRKAYKIGFKQLQEKTFFVLSILTNLDSCTCVYQMLLRETIVEKYHLWFPKVSWVVFSVPTSNIEIWSWCNFRWASAQQNLCWQVHNELHLENSQCLEMSWIGQIILKNATFIIMSTRVTRWFRWLFSWQYFRVTRDLGIHGVICETRWR